MIEENVIESTLVLPNLIIRPAQFAQKHTAQFAHGKNTCGHYQGSVTCTKDFRNFDVNYNDEIYNDIKLKTTLCLKHNISDNSIKSLISQSGTTANKLPEFVNDHNHHLVNYATHFKDSGVVPDIDMETSTSQLETTENNLPKVFNDHNQHVVTDATHLTDSGVVPDIDMETSTSQSESCDTIEYVSQSDTCGTTEYGIKFEITIKTNNSCDGLTDVKSIICFNSNVLHGRFDYALNVSHKISNINMELDPNNENIEVDEISTDLNHNVSQNKSLEVEEAMEIDKTMETMEMCKTTNHESQTFDKQSIKA